MGNAKSACQPLPDVRNCKLGYGGTELLRLWNERGFSGTKLWCASSGDEMFRDLSGNQLLFRS